MYILTTVELVILFIDQWFDEVGVVVLITSVFTELERCYNILC